MYLRFATCLVFALVFAPLGTGTAVIADDDDGPELFGPRLIAPPDPDPEDADPEVSSPVEPTAPPQPVDNEPVSAPGPAPTPTPQPRLVPPVPLESLPPRRVPTLPNAPTPIDQPGPALRTVPGPQLLPPIPTAPVPHETRRVTAVPTGGAPLHIEIGESFANRWLSQRTTKQEPVRDVVLEADVEGWQTTTTNVTVDILPGETGGRLDFKAEGETYSDTLGLTEKATLRTVGRHRFHGTKPVLLFGDRFLVKRATVFVQPSNTTVGLATKYDGLPLIGPIATRTAIRKSEESRPAAEKIAADRLAERVLPQFDGEINDRLNGANALIAARKESLVERDLWPTQITSSSTDVRLSLDAVFGEGEMVPIAPVPRIGELRNDDVLFAVHESLPARFLEGMELGGRVSSKDDATGFFESLPEWVRVTKPEPADGDDALDGSMAGLVKFVLDEDRPVRVAFADDRAYVTLRLRIRPAIGNDLPANDVRLAVKGELTEEGLVFTTESVDVSRVDGKEDDLSRQMSRMLGDRLKAELPTITIPAAVPMPMVTANGVGSIGLTDLHARDGWLIVRAK